MALVPVIQANELGDAPTLTITFPSGAEFHTRMLALPPIYRIPGNARRLTDFYDEIRAQAAAGDAVASTALHRFLEQCRLAYTDARSLDRAIETLHEARVVVFPGGSHPPLKLPGDASPKQMEFALLRQPYEFCRGITDAQKLESEVWLQNAIRKHEYWSLEEVAVKLGNTATGVAYWKSLWRQGHFSALPALNVFYQRGVAGSAPDPVRAYAYNYLQLKLVQAAFATGRSAVTLQQLRAVEATERRSAAELSPAEREEALQLAEQLLRESTGCCVGIA